MPTTDVFAQIRDDYYRAWFRFHPEAALDAGVQGYDHLLRPCSDEDQGALLALNEMLLAALEELDESALDPDELIDLKLMRGAAFLEMEEIIEFDWRGRDPELFLPLHGIYQLIIRHTDNFAHALRRRLSEIPAYLDSARQYTSREPERIPLRWIESALTGVETGVVFLRDLPTDTKVQAHSSELKDLGALIDDAVRALHGYARFIETEIGARAAGDYAVGARRYMHLLRYRHFLDIDQDELHAFGAALFDRTQAELKGICRRLTGGDDVAALDARIASEFAPDDSLLTIYREQMQAARAFSVANDLVGLPASEQLSVADTPLFLRHKIPFAAYEPPAPSDNAQHGHYFITPPRDAEERNRHNTLASKHTCVHEAYPGHHLQFAVANHNPAACTLPRLLGKSATLYEGWALYCEQLMFERGFLNQPENEYILLKDRLWRALRVVIDVGIHTGGQAMDDAAQLMVDGLGFTRSQALGEVTWYSRAPCVPLGYATGWAMINAARERVGTAGKDLREFHDRLLRHGSIPLSLVLDRAFGGGLGKRVQSDLLVSEFQKGE